MNARKTFSTAGRVLHQLRRDPPTLGLIFLIPAVLIIILRFAFQSRLSTFNNVAPMMQGIFPLIIIFAVTSVVTLRERVAGTLDRLMTMPISKFDIIFGYSLAFGLIALLQASWTTFILLAVLHVPVLGGTWSLLIGGVISALLGMALGLFVSSFAKSEFQAIQFMPAIVLPQFLICGFFIAREHMAILLQWMANVMPLSYSVDAMKQITLHASRNSIFFKDMAIVIIYIFAVLILGTITIRRQE